MTLDLSMLSSALGEVLQGAVLLLCVLMCISTLYLLLLHLTRALRTWLEARGMAIAGGG